jgi:hypothetical protein
LKLPGFQHHETLYLVYIVGLALADSVILFTMAQFVRETAIAQISGVFVTVEGVLIGLTPQIKYKPLRDLVAFFGIVSLLVSVLTFTKSTYEAIQLGYLSLDVTTILFKASGALFLGFVELYATAILSPLTPKDPDKMARKRVAEAW